MKKRGIRLYAVLIALLLLAACIAAGQLLMPVRRDYGATWECYLQEQPDSIDVLYFGSSLVYCDVVPGVIWDESGLTSYCMAGPEQTIPISYYYLREACRTQQPQAVVLELTGMFFQRYQNFTKVNIGYMPWDINRLAATFAAAEPAERLGLLFPLYNYHDRAYTAQQTEVEQHLQPEADDLAGYTLLTAAEPQEAVWYRGFTAETETYRQNLQYLRKIADFCEKRGIQLVLYVAPAYGRIPEAELSTLEEQLQEIAHTAYWNCNDGTWPELDGQTAWYDELHYNINGAVPFSGALAQRLETLGLTVTHEDDAVWKARAQKIRQLQSEAASAQET